MKNLELAQLFDRTADVMAVQGENAFRINAYRKIARVLEELPQDVEELAKSKELEELPGIGESSAAKIREYLRTGHISEFESIWSEVPAGVMAMMKVPALGPKTAALLWQEGGITSVEQLKAALEAKGYGGLTKLPGMGEKKLEKIRQNLAFLSTSAGRVNIGHALPVAKELVAAIRKLPGVVDAAYCGSLRRGRETVGDIDIAVAAPAEYGEAISAAITKNPNTAEVLAAGPTKTSIRTTTGIQVDVRVVPAESFGAALQYFTGSKEHGVRVREIAVRKGYKLNEWGLFKGDTRVAGETEEGIYHALGLACPPPEMREDRGEMEVLGLKGEGRREKGERKDERRSTEHESPAACGEIRLVEITDIRGDLHMHTTASDGLHSIEEMVAECKRRGFEYMAITDHSKSEFQANGLRVDRLLEHVQAIHAVAREAKGILVLAGSEVDILADGSLDYEDQVLAKLDWVVASPHAALTQDADAATQRLVRVMANPYVHVIGHPTGRMVPSRRGLEPDMKAVIFAAARNGVALELNAHYMRLDLRDTHLRMAKEAGVPICINTDAHILADFEMLQYGILTARRGWLTKEDVLNTRPVAAFKKWLQQRKEQAGW